MIKRRDTTRQTDSRSCCLTYHTWVWLGSIPTFGNSPMDTSPKENTDRGLDPVEPFCLPWLLTQAKNWPYLTQAQIPVFYP